MSDAQDLAALQSTFRVLQEMLARANDQAKRLGDKIEAMAAGASTGTATSAAGQRVRTWLFEGEYRTAAQLAKRAGCSDVAMFQRLTKLQRSPADAVAMGARPPRSSATLSSAYSFDRPFASPPPPAVTPAPTAAPTPASTPAPTAAPTPMPTRAPAPSPAPQRLVPTPAAPSPLKLAREVEAVVPAGVKRTVAATPRDRFAPDPALVVPVFSKMRPGEYLPESSAIARHYRGDQD